MGSLIWLLDQGLDDTSASNEVSLAVYHSQVEVLDLGRRRFLSSLYYTKNETVVAFVLDIHEVSLASGVFIYPFIN